MGEGRLRVIVREGWGYGFLVNVEGRSWQGPDEKVVSWLERHYLLDIVAAVLGVILMVGFACQIFDWTCLKLHGAQCWCEGEVGDQVVKSSTR